ncbi:MAG: Gfo/Idh/MocA family oxidoreductase [Clostridia bacterium]|nr:Gfo/Idh/MocA family oxidoreductase [Clostridia bacterium]
MNKIKILLTGIGGYASTYVNPLLDSMLDNSLDNKYPDCEITACADPYPDSCPRIAEIREKNIPVYADMNDFFADGGTADLCVITTPIHLHARQMKTAFAHGCHVLCEKPLCGDACDIDSLLEAEEASGKYAAIGYQWSHSPAIQALKADIMAGLYGDPVMLKSIVLWPRDRAYYARGCGWAGKLRSADGSLILDSVANNATAHYLHNILYVLGETVDSSAMPTGVKAELYRANAIENYDTCKIHLTFASGAEALFIASHATDKTYNPVFEYRFTRGTVTYTEADGRREIIGTLPDGTSKNYGNPFNDPTTKLTRAVEAVKNPAVKPICGIRAASAHAKVIAEAQKSGITDFPQEKIRENAKGTGVYVEGLYEELMALYENA